jgi:hypothetical protein
MDFFNLYQQIRYEQSRKEKMYRQNPATIYLDVEELLSSLKGVDVSKVHIRFFFTRFSESSTKDLVINYPEKTLKQIFLYGLHNNLPLTVRNVFCNGNTYIYDLICLSTNKAIRHLLRSILQHESCSFVSRVEIHTEGRQKKLFFVLEGISRMDYSLYSLFSSEERVDNFEPIEKVLPLNFEKLMLYYRFLKKHYVNFYRDVQNRACTIWCFRENFPEYIVKRRVWNQPIIFPASFKEAEALLQTERVVQIVPNTLPEARETPCEMVIDIDVLTSVKYSVVQAITDTFAQWLKSKKIMFLRRLTGSRRGGQHFLIPLCWERPWLLGGKTPLWENYTRSSKSRILCDSVRSMAELLCLLFQKAHQDLAPRITTRIFDSWARHQRILFDTSCNGLNRGRRALLSLHHRSLNVCIPLKTDLPSKAELEEKVALETVFAAPEGESQFEELEITETARSHNTWRLRQLIHRYEQLYYEYLATPAERFEELHFDIPIKRGSFFA